MRTAYDQKRAALLIEVDDRSVDLDDIKAIIDLSNPNMAHVKCGPVKIGNVFKNSNGRWESQTPIGKRYYEREKAAAVDLVFSTRFDAQTWADWQRGVE